MIRGLRGVEQYYRVDLFVMGGCVDMQVELELGKTSLKKDTSSSGHCPCPKYGGGRATLLNIFKIKFSQDRKNGHKA